jgi:solute carrier family 25 S-adenosylmethionine transporter 26
MSKQKGDFGREFLAGSAAGILSDAITHPIDTVRANLQYQRGFSNLKYGSARGAFTSLLRERALYRGFLSVAVTTVPAHGLYFTGFEWASRWYQRKRPGEEFRSHLFGGLVAEVAGASVWVPADVIKQRVQLSADKSTVAAVRRLLAEDGVRGFYRGYWTSLATYGPFVALYFASYEWLLDLFPNRAAAGAQVVCGTTAAVVASFVTNPVDVIKTRVQIDNRRALDVTRQLLRDEGPRAFLKGATARMSWIAPTCAIGMVTYEQCKLLLGLR